MKYNFIEKAKEVHGKTYSYANTVYTNKRTKVTITCKTHGDFLQSPQHHLQGSGCKKCYIFKMKNSTQDFIKKAQQVHNNKYDYSKSIYTKSKDKVIIICLEHGEFKQEANSHLRGRGCLKCVHVNDKETFIKKATQIHNNKYNYSEFDYIDSYTKSKIICPIHGVFKQTSNTHLDGSGCPSCGKIQSGFSLTLFKNRCNKNNNGVGIFYIIKCFNETEEFYKIGITSKSIKQRYSNKSRMPYKYIITQEIQDTPENIFKLENIIKKYFLKFKYEPLFKFHGSSTECFK